MSNYVKKYDLGEMYLELPQKHCIYELPLLSFSDMRSGVTLSLMFNQALEAQGQNIFHIAAGYKLNLEKRFIVASDGTATFYEANGKSVALNKIGEANENEPYTYTFPDDSQRIIRPTSSGDYWLEYPDYSREEYSGNGRIESVVDKYGKVVFNYTYENDLLTMIVYRPNELFPIRKQMILEYNESSKLSRIRFRASNNGTDVVTIMLSYSNTTVVVTHYSGVQYALYYNDLATFEATVTGSDCRRSIKYTPTGGDTRSMIEYEDDNEVCRTVYKFPNLTNAPAASFTYVDVTDHLGVTTRMQFDGDKLLYSYEIGENGPVFLSDGKFAGNVQVHQTEGSSINSKTSYVQRIDSGEPMTDGIGNGWWSFGNKPAGSEGFHIISGWVKYKNADSNNHPATTSLWTFDTWANADYAAGGIITDQWMYFAFALVSDSNAVRFKFDHPNELEVKDLRIMFQATHVEDEDGKKMNSIYIEDVLISKTSSNNDNAYAMDLIIPVKEVLFSCGGNNVSFEDLLRYKINQERGIHSTEFYSDTGKTVHTIASDESVTFTFGEQSHNLNDFYIGKRKNTAKGSIITRIKGREGINLLVVEEIEVVEDQRLLGDLTTYTLKRKQLISDRLDVTLVEENDLIVTYARTDGLLITTSVYDKNNNLLQETTTSRDEEEGIMITTDEFDKQTKYTMDTVWGGVIKIELPDGSVIENAYDSDGCALVSKAFSGAQTTPITHNFGYVGGNLTSMSVHDGIGYGFAYDQGELVEVTKAGTIVEQHSHTQSATGSTTTSAYPNSDSPLYSISRTYDKYGRLTSVDSDLSCTYDIAPEFDEENGTLIEKASNGSAKLAMTIDSKAIETSRYSYDTEGRLMQKIVTDEDDFAEKVSSETFVYDNFGRLETDTYTFGTPSETITTEVSYVSESDNRIQSHTHIVAKVPLGETAEVETARVVTANTYDVQKRVILKTMSFYDKTFGRHFTYDKNRICGVADTISNGVCLESAYAFDTLGRITGDTHTFVGSATADDFKVYDYDEYGRLVQESNLGLDKVFVYEYNTIGNITNVKTYARADDGTASGTPNTKTYTYDTTHPDRLVTFGGKAITYNTNGEMASYDGWTYSWSKGKLTGKSKGTRTTGRNSYSFSYNALGQRMSAGYSYMHGTSSLIPVQMGEVTAYTKSFKYDNAGRLLSESILKTLYQEGTESTEIVYLYDGNTMIGMEYTSVNGTALYFFHRNLQGDVLGIYDMDGNLKVKYNYDAWGNCTIDSETTDMILARVNPIRYRGYYYDQDTGLYYLNARYYSPELRRFISPDDTAYLGPENANGLNLYAYCCNAPVNYADPSGHLAFWIITAIIGAVIGVGVTAAVDYIPDQEFNLHWGWYILGAGIGALVGAGIGMAISYSATGTVTASFTDIKFGYALKAAQRGDYNKLAKFATHNNRSKKVGLGKYIDGSPNSYEVLSRKHGYTYYEMKQKYFDLMYKVLKEDVWKVNQTFLDQQLALGKTFVKLSTDYSGWYLKELQYLGLL